VAVAVAVVADGYGDNYTGWSGRPGWEKDAAGRLVDVDDHDTMLPSRGLRPAQLVPLASRRSRTLGSNASRQYSSLHRTATLATPSCRYRTLQPSVWRTGAVPASSAPATLRSAGSVRFGSWYAPWSWGKASSPAGEAATTSAATAADEAVSAADAISRATPPEAAPAPAAAEATAAPSDLIDHQTLDELLAMDAPSEPVKLPADFDPTQLIDHAGQLKELGLDYGWGVTAMLEHALEHIYLATGWGWAGSIIASCVGVRALMFFLQVSNSDKMAVMASLQPVTRPIQDKLDEAIARGDKNQVNILRLKQQEILKPYLGGMASAGGFMVAQAWLGFSAFRLLRALGELPVPGMAQDGYLWFTDLTVGDPYYVLPAATSALMYMVLKLGGETGINNDAMTSRKWVIPAMSAFLGLVSAFQPAGVQLYFLTSSVLGGITGSLLRRNWFRRLVRIRPIPSKESNEIFAKVVKGDLTLSQIKSPTGQISYQAPKALTSAKAKSRAATKPPPPPSTALAGLKIKAGTPVPTHLGGTSSAPKVENSDEPRSCDDDYEQGISGKTVREKLDWITRNYRPVYVMRRMAQAFERQMRSLGLNGKKVNVGAEKRKRRAMELEMERRRRFVQR